MSGTTQRPTAATSQNSSRSNLPGLDQRPDGLVVIYDGHCAFCRKQVQRLHAFDGGGQLAFVSLHDPIVPQRYPQLSHDELMKQLYVVDQQGNAYGGAAAFRLLSRRLPRLWFLAPLMHIPFSLPLWQWCYRAIATRRYRLQADCDDGTCQLHQRK